jgi:hypothetical protein
VRETQKQYDDGKHPEQQYSDGDEHAPTSSRSQMIEDTPSAMMPQNLAAPPGIFAVGAQAAKAQPAAEPQRPPPPPPAPSQARYKVPPPAMPSNLASSSSSRDPMEAVPIPGGQAHIEALEAKIDALMVMVQTLIDRQNLNGMS